MQAPGTTLAIPFVDLKAQYESIKPEIDAAIAAVISDTAFVSGPFVKAFEDAFAQYCEVGHCVGVANGTDALFIALRTLGVGPGDEVITVANSFVATSEAIRMAGAQVVFVDINPLTLNIDVERIEEK
ncbi:MAG: erythromycin biosynthesis sensory transduction protein eryC1, partial [Acidobacteria bacterium]